MGLVISFGLKIIFTCLWLLCGRSKFLFKLLVGIDIVSSQQIFWPPESKIEPLQPGAPTKNMEALDSEENKYHETIHKCLLSH